MPISLTDDELQIVMSAAQPIPPDRREQFLIDVAAQLEFIAAISVLASSAGSPPTFSERIASAEFPRQHCRQMGPLSAVRIVTRT